MSAPPPLGGSRWSSRLELRPLVVADAPALHRYRSRLDVCRYIYSEPLPLSDIVTRLEGPWSRQRVEHEGEGVSLAVVRRDTGVLIGDVVLMWVSERDRLGEIGWVLSPEHSGRGYATEATHRLLHVAFDEWQLHRVIARVDARNEASHRVARHLGLREEAHLVSNEWFKGEWTSEVDYALLDHEWRDGRVPCSCDDSIHGPASSPAHSDT